MKDSERDRSVERLLRATPRSILPAAPSPACLEANAIASWAEGALEPDEATRVEAHVAECPRCQAALAAFVRAEPPTAPAAAVWTRWTTVLLPIAAAAAAVAIWIAWPRRQSPAAPVATVAEAPGVVEPRPQPAPVPTPPPAAARAKPGGSPTRSAGANAADATSATKSVAPSMSPSPVFRSLAPPAATPVPLIAPPPQTPVSAQAAARPAAIGESPLTDQRLAASAGGASGVRATTEPIVAFDSPAASGGAGGASAAAASGGRGGGGGTPTVLREAATRTSSVTRWRILASRDLERSTDDGQTWQRVAIDPPSSLTNGVAPSRLVCWLVGRAGVVLVTNDADHFTRLAFPETMDLSSVQATDLLDATVTTADGHAFVTTDGGKTWTVKRRLTPHENDLRSPKPPKAP